VSVCGCPPNHSFVSALAREDPTCRAALHKTSHVVCSRCRCVQASECARGKAKHTSWMGLPTPNSYLAVCCRSTWVSVHFVPKQHVRRGVAVSVSRGSCTQCGLGTAWRCTG
jgi:hypothetical protein